MSKDKRKKRLRAMEFLRALNAERRAPHSGITLINRKLSPVIRYCVERGLATVRRKRLGKNATRAVLDTGLHDHNPVRATREK
jgi:hypothetical protein